MARGSRVRIFLAALVGLALVHCGRTPTAVAPAAIAPATQADDPRGPDIMDAAPDFTLPDTHGVPVQLSALTKKGPVLIIFYLGYNCPRCVAHLREIEARLDDIHAAGAQVVAISPDTPERLKESADAFGDFPFPLLADPELKAFHAYGLVFGKETIFHGCFIADKENRVAFAMASSHPYDNIEALVTLLRSMNDGK